MAQKHLVISDKVRVYVHWYEQSELLKIDIAAYDEEKEGFKSIAENRCTLKDGGKVAEYRDDIINFLDEYNIIGDYATGVIVIAKEITNR